MPLNTHDKRQYFFHFFLFGWWCWRWYYPKNRCSTTPYSTVLLQYLVAILRTVVPSKSLMLKTYSNWNDFRNYGTVNVNADTTSSVDIIKYWHILLILFVFIIIIIIIIWKIKLTPTMIGTVPLCKLSGWLRHQWNRSCSIVFKLGWFLWLWELKRQRHNGL